MLCGGLCRPGGRDNFRGCSALLEMHFNSNSAKNGNTLTAQYTYKLYNMYIPTDRIWLQQYTGVVCLQMHICIYAKKYF